MPGIFGVHKKDPGNKLSQLMGKMISSMNHDGRMIVDEFMEDDRGLGMGRVSLGVLNSVKQPVKNPEGNCFIIFHGELYNNTGTLNDPEYVLSEYIQKGDSCAAELNGIFHFIIYDKSTEQIKLFSDKFGLQPLYYSILPDGIVFGAEVKALLEDSRIVKTPDHRSFADFFHYGQVLGQKTLFKDVKLLAPGSLLTFNLRELKDFTKQYWHLDNLFVKNGNYNLTASVDDTVSLLIQSIKSNSTNREILGLSLSGGLDSRGILAGLGMDAENIRTYTLGLPGCADEILAEKMALAAKTDHEFVLLNQAYLRDFENMAHNMIHLSDGMYHPHESTEMLALEYFKSDRLKILLRGHGGEIAKAALAYPVMVTPQIDSCSNSKEILNFIFNSTNLVTQNLDPGKLFVSEFCDLIKESPVQSLRESCGNVSESLAPADVCIYYYINEHIRRQVIASLDIFRTRIEIRMPYVDEAYLESLLTLPIKFRNTGEIHFELIKRCMPGLIKITNSNTGAPLDAGPLRLFLSDKFNSLMKKLSVRGFRHYTEFQKWHRESFRHRSEEIIFNDQTASRNIYNMDYLKSVFEAHISGKQDFGHLLGTIVGLEFWFRNFVD